MKRLAPCPDRPNCVSTQALSPKHAIEPLTVHKLSNPMSSLKTVIQKMPRSNILAETPEYLRVEFSSLLFRFVDDVEFLIDRKSNLIHFRSASRVGYSDLGANRARMEKIREMFRQLHVEHFRSDSRE